MFTRSALPRDVGSRDVPTIGLFRAHRGTYPDAVAETDAGAVTGADARTDARTDDGDARAHTGTVREPDARALVATDDGRALKQADASALLV
jgi:hypothetical protein